MSTFWRSGKKYVKEKIWDDADDAKIGWLFNNSETSYLRLILCAKHTGSWTTIQGTTVTSTVLVAT